MNLHQAKRIIEDNYITNDNSLCYLLYDESDFSITAFWEFYDAIAFLTRNSIKDELLSTQIAKGYQHFLRELIYHFSPFDLAKIRNLPKNYNDYIERLEWAVRAYFEGKPEWLDDNGFFLQR